MTDLEIGLAIWLGALWLIGAALMATALRAQRSALDSGFWAAVAFWPPVMAGALALGFCAVLAVRFRNKRRRK